MPLLLKLLSSKYLWIALIISALAGGVWLKVHSLEADVAKAQKALTVQVEDNKVLTLNNATLKQSLETALAINKDNADMLKQIKLDQLTAARSLAKLATDLTATKRSLADARKKLEDVQAPTYPVPPNIITAVEAIQSSRDEVKE